MQTIIEQGIKQGLIKLSEDEKQITYLHQTLLPH